ncbi:uncharacterized protein Dana_GF24303, isoform C [Drosophila ananassae]|uniref:Uncharacterized protein, isoform C n=1 Tax=Drosophila ananassae TaxID=7217 RepID=A0A0P8Y9R5_DROAN|nr:uncharacterized protein Dana_GF24303, isoform C [Drosophila ananassae]
MEYSNTTGLNHNIIVKEDPEQNHHQHQQSSKTRLSVIGSYFKIDSPIGVQPVAIALGSQRCLNTPPTTPSSPLREAPQSPSDGHISSLSSHSGSGCSDILLACVICRLIVASSGKCGKYGKCDKREISSG